MESLKGEGVRILLYGLEAAPMCRMPLWASNTRLVFVNTHRFKSGMGCLNLSTQRGLMDVSAKYYACVLSSFIAPTTMHKPRVFDVCRAKRDKRCRWLWRLRDVLGPVHPKCDLERTLPMASHLRPRCFSATMTPSTPASALKAPMAKIARAPEAHHQKIPSQQQKAVREDQ